MKKYLIKEMYNNYNDVYYDNLIDDLKSNYNDLVFIGGNKDFSGINYDIINTLIDKIYYYSDYELEYYYKNHVVNYLIDIIKPFKKINVKQALKIASLLKDNSVNKETFILESLKIIFSKRYETTILRGYCQSDWIKCYYAIDKMDHDFINYIEAVLFNTGIEIFISNEKIEIESINPDIEIDGYYDYIVNGFIDDKKQAAAGVIGCGVNEIAYLEIKDVKQYTSYKIIYDEVK